MSCGNKLPLLQGNKIEKDNSLLADIPLSYFSSSARSEFGARLGPGAPDSKRRSSLLKVTIPLSSLRKLKQKLPTSIRLARTAYLPRLDLLWQENRASTNNVFGALFPRGLFLLISGPALGRHPWRAHSAALGERCFRGNLSILV